MTGHSLKQLAFARRIAVLVDLSAPIAKMSTAFARHMITSSIPFDQLLASGAVFPIDIGKKPFQLLVLSTKSRMLFASASHAQPPLARLALDVVQLVEYFVGIKAFGNVAEAVFPRTVDRVDGRMFGEPDLEGINEKRWEERLILPKYAQRDRITAAAELRAGLIHAYHAF